MSLADDLDITARTVWGEARGESFQGQLAVAWVIANRAAAQIRGKTPREVCLSPWQFSVWNAADPNLKRLASLSMDSEPGLLNAYAAAAAALSRVMPDPTQGATDYYAVARPPGVDVWPPPWAADYIPTVRIGGHQFMRRM